MMISEITNYHLFTMVSAMIAELGAHGVAQEDKIEKITWALLDMTLQRYKLLETTSIHNTVNSVEMQKYEALADRFKSLLHGSIREAEEQCEGCKAHRELQALMGKSTSTDSVAPDLAAALKDRGIEVVEIRMPPDRSADTSP